MNALPADLILKGWNGEVANHRRELGRALADIQQAAVLALAALERGDTDTVSIRRIAAGSTDALQHGAALTALGRVQFALPKED